MLLCTYSTAHDLPPWPSVMRSEWLQPISWHGAISAKEGNRILGDVAESRLSWELCKKEEQLVAGEKAEWHSEAEQRALEWLSVDNGRQLELIEWSPDAEGKGQDCATRVTGILINLTGAELFSGLKRPSYRMVPGCPQPWQCDYNLSLCDSPGRCHPFCELVWASFQSCS